MNTGDRDRFVSASVVLLLILGVARFGFGSEVVFGPGDVKEGYESADYETRSRSLQHRTGKAVDLLRVLAAPPLGLPEIPVPKANPITAAKVALGRKLFFDRRLSLNETFSCAMCHVPEQGFTSNELATAVGIEGRTVRRNSPTIYNVAYFTNIFHDGRELSLEHQIWQPLLAANEMGNPGIDLVIEKIKRQPDYDGMFATAFGSSGPTMESIGMAIASYERLLVSGKSPFDRWYYGGEETALSDVTKRGFRLFTGKAECASCHTIGEQHALFTDDDFHNTGIGWQAAQGGGPETYQVQLAPGVRVQVPSRIIEQVGEPPPSDLGRYEVTQDPADRWRYKTPILRNVALTAPYMHNGVFSTLRQVVSFYNQGGIDNPFLDPRIRPLNLTTEEEADIVAFLMALTGDNIETLVRDAFAAPVGDRQ
jgi:cytochrome c peroxidase